MTVALHSDGTQRQPEHNQVARVIATIILTPLRGIVRRNYTVCQTKRILRNETKHETSLSRQFNQKTADKIFVTDVTYICTLALSSVGGKMGWTQH